MWQPAAALSTITVIGVIGRELIQRTTQEKASLFHVLLFISFRVILKPCNNEQTSLATSSDTITVTGAPR